MDNHTNWLQLRNNALGTGNAIMNTEIQRLNIALDAARRQQSSSDREISELQEKIKKMELDALQLKEAIKLKDDLLKEWIHSNEAFKQLAREYAEKLNISPDEQQKNADNKIIDLSEQDPKYQNTKLTDKAKASLAGNKV